jgi:hypothetical protein
VSSIRSLRFWMTMTFRSAVASYWPILSIRDKLTTQQANTREVCLHRNQFAARSLVGRSQEWRPWHYAIAKAALEKIGPGAKPVLQHLALSGTLTFGIYNPPLPPGISGESTRTILIYVWTHSWLRNDQSPIVWRQNTCMRLRR